MRLNFLILCGERIGERLTLDPPGDVVPGLPAATLTWRDDQWWLVSRDPATFLDDQQVAAAAVALRPHGKLQLGIVTLQYWQERPRSPAASTTAAPPLTSELPAPGSAPASVVTPTSASPGSLYDSPTIILSAPRVAESNPRTPEQSPLDSSLPTRFQVLAAAASPPTVIVVPEAFLANPTFHREAVSSASPPTMHRAPADSASPSPGGTDGEPAAAAKPLTMPRNPWSRPARRRYFALTQSPLQYRRVPPQR